MNKLDKLKYSGKCDWYGEPAHELMHWAADEIERLKAAIEVKDIQIRCLGEGWDAIRRIVADG